MALLARFACGCTLRVEIPAPERVLCAEHGAVAILIQTPRGQVRYVSAQGPVVSAQKDEATTDIPDADC
jgi:hypothetical protein